MLRTTLHVTGLALVFAAGVACFGLFSSNDADRAPADPCAGLTGQAKVDCEQQQRPRQ